MLHRRGRGRSRHLADNSTQAVPGARAGSAPRGSAKPLLSQSIPAAIDRAPTRSYTRSSEPVAQPVEHLTFNQGVLGSSPSGLTKQINWLAPARRERRGNVRHLWDKLCDKSEEQRVDGRDPIHGQACGARQECRERFPRRGPRQADADRAGRLNLADGGAPSSRSFASKR